MLCFALPLAAGADVPDSGIATGWATDFAATPANLNHKIVAIFIDREMLDGFDEGFGRLVHGWQYSTDRLSVKIYSAI